MRWAALALCPARAGSALPVLPLLAVVCYRRIFESGGKQDAELHEHRLRHGTMPVMSLMAVDLLPLPSDGGHGLHVPVSS